MNELFKKHSPVDMSPEAVGRRLRMLGELYKLGMSLRKAKPIVTAKSGETFRSPGVESPKSSAPSDRAAP